jgi:hypothetical protein
VFIRAAGPGVLIVGAGAATVSAAAGSTALVSAGMVGAAAATLVVLPAYYLSVLGINHHNKKAVMTEFKRRCLSLPLTLAPSETRTGNLFYPMVRSPARRHSIGRTKPVAQRQYFRSNFFTRCMCRPLA